MFTNKNLPLSIASSMLGFSFLIIVFYEKNESAKKHKQHEMTECQKELASCNQQKIQLAYFYSIGMLTSCVSRDLQLVTIPILKDVIFIFNLKYHLSSLSIL